MLRRAMIFCAALAALAAAAGCAERPVPIEPPRYASAEQVEISFRGRRFILGEDTQVALVRAEDWPEERALKLPYWLGINVLVPGVLQPKEGDYYVISEAELSRPLEEPGEWLIEAGSRLVKQQAVYITTRTRYAREGKILPTIVQFVGMREFKRGDGQTVELPVLREVSLPMKWTLKGRVPRAYAPYQIR
jgi:hypothetical protein